MYIFTYYMYILLTYKVGNFSFNVVILYLYWIYYINQNLNKLFLNNMLYHIMFAVFY